MKRTHFSKLLLVIIILCTLASLRFLAVGAWPVVLFLGADIGALWFAFWINYRRARAHETICLTDTHLIIERQDARGNSERWRFEPYWATLQLLKDDHYGNQLQLSEHGQQVMLGTFLAPFERKELYEALSKAMYAWKHRQPGAVT